MEVVWESSTATEALSRDRCVPDVLILDLDLGSENGLVFLPKLRQRFASVRVLVLTATTAIETHLAAVQAGASGVIVKGTSPEELIEAIRSIRAGEGWLARSLMTAVLGKVLQSDRERKAEEPERKKISQLTPREIEVIHLVCEGFNGERIAEQMRIAEVTVRNHLTSILGKLDLANKFELVVYAYRMGLGPKPRGNGSR
jgi:DNA-binding NarL/FixJ family response regulator